MISLMGKSCIPKLHPCSTKRIAPRIAISAGHVSRHYNMHNKPNSAWHHHVQSLMLACESAMVVAYQEACSTKHCVGNCTAISSEGSRQGMQDVAVPVIM
jgi:hypothetical protein